MTFSAPRLYLAAGVTTIRTAGSVEPDADLNLKTAIDQGRLPGPRLDVTAPYLDGGDSDFLQVPRIRTPEAARAHVAFWSDRGATSFKAYTNLDRASLRAAIEAAHRRGLKVTGHLCAVTYDQAADLGIDNLEHGFFVNTQLDPGKADDVCPATGGDPTLEAMTPDSPHAKALIRKLVARKVAVTSTLPVFEAAEERPALSGAERAVLSPQSVERYEANLALLSRLPPEAKAEAARRFANAVALERAFVAAGGLLIAGPDPTGAGNVLPGFGDLRGIELLVKAGFRPEEAIRIASLNGAIYLGMQDRIGSVEAGKIADLVVVRGDPSKNISDVRNVEIVFKDGVGYDPAKLLQSVTPRYGEY